MALLSGCAITSSNAKPDLIGYTDKQQDKMADEMESGQCNALGNAMIGYIKTRQQIRAIK